MFKDKVALSLSLFCSFSRDYSSVEFSSSSSHCFIDQINGDSDRLVSRASNLLHNKSFTDVTFIVGPPAHSKKYVGHRVLLAMTSPGKINHNFAFFLGNQTTIFVSCWSVFEAMFYGDMADKSKVIRIPDIAPIGFENLLRYAYTDSLNLNSVDDAMLTAYAAKKYLLPHLLR